MFLFFIFRSTSKASYLPRQTHEKHLLDPDHGSYKLTLTSNEDCINHKNVFSVSEEILPTKCNLPDVLPVSVKLQKPRYSSSQQQLNNFSTTAAAATTKTLPPHTAPIVPSNPLKSMFNFHLNSNTNNNNNINVNNNTSPPPYSPRTPPSPQIELSSPKYTSQSTFDLKKTQVIDQQSIFTSNSEVIRKISLDNISVEKVSIEDNQEEEEEQQQQHDELEVENVVKDISILIETEIEEITQDDESLEIKLEKTVESVSTQISSLDIKAEPNDQIRQSSPKLILSQINPETDGLKLIQKSEIVLRVNAATSEAGCQTEDDEIQTMPLTPRKKHPEEIDCERLAKDLVSQLSPSDKLTHVLAPKMFKSSSDYVSGLYNPNIKQRFVKKDVVEVIESSSPVRR